MQVSGFRKQTVERRRPSTRFANVEASYGVQLRSSCFPPPHPPFPPPPTSIPQKEPQARAQQTQTYFFELKGGQQSQRIFVKLVSSWVHPEHFSKSIFAKLVSSWDHPEQFPPKNVCVLICAHLCSFVHLCSCGAT